jgi:hypothetical protein
VPGRHGPPVLAPSVLAVISRHCTRPRLMFSCSAAIMSYLLLSPSIAFAQAIPDYDRQAYCERRAERSAQLDAALKRCLWLEQYALDELETFWPRAGAELRQECLEIASADESYVVLVRCVMAGLRRSR